MPLSSVATEKVQGLGMTRMRSEKWLMKFEWKPLNLLLGTLFSTH